MCTKQYIANFTNDIAATCMSFVEPAHFCGDIYSHSASMCLLLYSVHTFTFSIWPNLNTCVHADVVPGGMPRAIIVYFVTQNAVIFVYCQRTLCLWSKNIALVFFCIYMTKDVHIHM